MTCQMFGISKHEPSARMRSEGYSLFVCLCPSVSHYIQAMRLPTSSELDTQTLKRNGRYPERTAFEKYAAKKPTCIIALGSLCVPWRLKKSQLMACSDSQTLSTSVASQCQTLCVLLAWRLHVKAYYIAQPSINSTAHAQ